MIFSVFQKIGFLGILDPPYCGIGATIRIGREMLCLPYAGFFSSFHAPFGIGACICIVREIRCLPYAGFFNRLFKGLPQWQIDHLVRPTRGTPTLAPGRWHRD